MKLNGKTEVCLRYADLYHKVQRSPFVFQTVVQLFNIENNKMVHLVNSFLRAAAGQPQDGILRLPSGDDYPNDRFDGIQCLLGTVVDRRLTGRWPRSPWLQA